MEATIKRKTKKSQGSSIESSISSWKQSAMCEFVIPKTTKRDLQKLEECMAMHYYITGTPFHRIEEDSLLKAFQICRSNAVLSNRKKLATVLLDQSYDVAKKQVGEFLQSAHAPTACLTTDAWSSIANKSAVNYMAMSGDKILS